MKLFIVCNLSIKFSDHIFLWQWRYNVFDLSQDLTTTPNYRFLRLYDTKLLIRHRSCGINFNFSHEFTQTLNQRVLRLYGKKLLITCNHPAKFGSHGHCPSGIAAYSICHVTLHNHMIKKSSVIMEGSSPLYVHCGSGNIIILIHQVSLCDHVFKGFCDFMDKSFLW